MICIYNLVGVGVGVAPGPRVLFGVGLEVIGDEVVCCVGVGSRVLFGVGSEVIGDEVVCCVGVGLILGP